MTYKIKLWLQLHKGDIISALKLLIPILLLIFIILKFPFLTRTYFLSKLDSEIVGVVDKIEKTKGIHESEIGGKIINKNYKIAYHYIIKREKIKGIEVIDRSSLNLKQKIRVNKIEIGDTILIRYDSRNIKSSKILIN